MHNFFRKNNKKLSKLRAQKASSSTFEEVVVDRYDPDLAIENVFEESIPNPTEYNMKVDVDQESGRDDSDSDWRDPVVIEEPLDNFFEEKINSKHLRKHLSSTVGGNRGIKAIKTLISRVTSFFSWLNKQWDRTSISYMVKKLLRTDYEIISDYVVYLHEVMARKGSTALSYLDDIMKYLKWYVLFKGRRHQRKLNPDDLTMQEFVGVEDVVKNVRRECRKQRKRDNATSKDIPTLRKLNMWPQGGMRQLNEAVEKELSWISRIDEGTVIDRGFFLSFSKALCASIYLSPQGRIQAVEDIRFGQANELKTNKFIMSKKFKTWAKYGYQPVTAGSIFLQIFEKYMLYVRPALKEKDTDFLFVDLEGNQIDMGRKLITFFESALGLHLTSTTIRSVVETEVNDLFNQGKLSRREKESMMNLNGHSSQVTHDYYIKQDRQRDVVNAFRCFDLINSPESGRTEQVPILRHKRYVIQDSSEDENDGNDEAFTAIKFKRVTQPTELFAEFQPTERMNQVALIENMTETIESEPEPSHFPMRVKWTEREINYVGRWCTKTLKDNPANNTNIVARCLAHIRNDPTIVAMFHNNHILNSGRLKHGYDSYRKQNILDE